MRWGFERSWERDRRRLAWVVTVGLLGLVTLVGAGMGVGGVVATHACAPIGCVPTYWDAILSRSDHFAVVQQQHDRPHWVPFNGVVGVVDSLRAARPVVTGPVVEGHTKVQPDYDVFVEERAIRRAAQADLERYRAVANGLWWGLALWGTLLALAVAFVLVRSRERRVIVSVQDGILRIGRWRVPTHATDVAHVRTRLAELRGQDFIGPEREVLDALSGIVGEASAALDQWTATFTGSRWQRDHHVVLTTTHLRVDDRATLLETLDPDHAVDFLRPWRAKDYDGPFDSAADRILSAVHRARGGEERPADHLALTALVGTRRSLKETR